MANHTFSVKYTSGSTVYLRFFDPAQGAGVNTFTFDFDDDAWEATLAAATTPKLAATEKTDPGDADESLYVATTDLTNMNATATPLEVLVQAVEDLATDVVIVEQTFWIVSGEIVDLADVEQISGDAAAADNLELQYDTTGLAGDTFPARQDALGNLTSGTAAINTTAVAAPGGFVITTGLNEANDEDSTHALDGVTHDLEDNAGTTDCYYIFNVGGNGVPVSVTWWGYIQSQGDDYAFYAYNWVTTAWEQIGSRSAVNGTTIVTETFDLSNAHVGTGANIGLVHFRIYSTDGTKVATDRILCSYAVVFQSVGYADGAIWVDTVGGAAGTVSFVNGVADNPVLTWADALTISGNLGLTRFRIINGSTITLSGNSDGYTLIGQAWSLVLNTQSCSGAFFVGAQSVTGICTGATEPDFEDCMFGNATLPPCHMTGCGFTATITIGSAGDFTFDHCHSMVPGTNTPFLDFGAALNASNVNIRHYSGGIELQNMGAGAGAYDMSLEGHGQLILNASCSATSAIAIRGHFTVTDNAGGAVTLSDDARYDVTQVNDEVAAALGTYDPPTNAEMVARTILAAAYFDPALDVVARVTLVDTTTANTDMRGTNAAALAAEWTAARAALIDNLDALISSRATAADVSPTVVVP